MTAIINTKEEKVFRHDVEGLRGLAILMVIIGHVWLGKVSGGVDVFLMISGFFLIPSLIKQSLTSKHTIKNIFTRLKKIVTKLWPPMALVIVTMTSIALLIIPKTRIESLIKESLASAGYFINWSLGLSEQSYGQAKTGVSIYQHLWSMSVQTQIFIGIIVTILVLGWSAKQAFTPHIAEKVTIITIILLTLISFIFAIWLHSQDQQLNYYHTFSRLWEILLGGVIGLIITKINMNNTIAEILAALGFCLLFVTIITLNGAQEFPGYLTLIPLGAASLIIVSGTFAHTVPTIILQSKIFTYIGTRAYHLYLWHWPILILWIEYSNNNFHDNSKHINLTQGIIIITISFIIAHLSYLLFNSDDLHERMGKLFTAGRFVIPAALLGVLILLTNPLTKVSEDLPVSSAQYPGALSIIGNVEALSAPVKPSVLTAAKDQTYTYDNGCFTSGEDASYRECVSGNPSSVKTLIVAGGSHSDHYLPALEDIANRHNIRIISILKAGCPVSWPDVLNDPSKLAKDDYCNAWRLHLFERINEIKPAAVFTTTTRPTENNQGDVVPTEYVNGVNRITSAGISVIGVRDNPWIIKSGDRSPVDCLAASGTIKTCGSEQSKVLSQKDPSIESYANITNRDKLSLLDFTAAFCNNNYCSPIIGNIMVYRDTNHLTTSYVKSMIPFIEQSLIEKTSLLTL